ncbi:MAG: hypothetical protein NVS2B12_07420 [Ktedonobacteraceae bacterium]
MPQFRSFQSDVSNIDNWLEGNGTDTVVDAPQSDASLPQNVRVPQVHLRPAPRQTRGTSLADHYRTVSLPVRREPASFISALQSTMSPHVRRKPLVIPGARQRAVPMHRLPKYEERLHPRLRLGIILALILIVLLFTTVSLTPLNNGQADVPFVGGFVRWAQDAQLKMDIAARHNQGTLMTNAGPTLPKSQYVAIAQADAQKYGISPYYFVNQIQQESHFDPYAQSDAGAVGIAQFEPATAAGMGINPYDPNSALDGAARYMANLQAQYGGDYAKALAAYNGGEGAVQAAVRNCGTGWLSCMPLQTQSYVYLIMR